MNLIFKTIPKKPKDKIQVLNGSGVLGYIDFYPEHNEYLFKSEFDKKFSNYYLLEIERKIVELNSTIKK